MFAPLSELAEFGFVLVDQWPRPPKAIYQARDPIPVYPQSITSFTPKSFRLQWSATRRSDSSGGQRFSHTSMFNLKARIPESSQEDIRMEHKSMDKSGAAFYILHLGWPISFFSQHESSQSLRTTSVVIAGLETKHPDDPLISSAGLTTSGSTDYDLTDFTAMREQLVNGVVAARCRADERTSTGDNRTPSSA
ncbi:hypothetical protein RSAG8_12752, partial [Rhizoctonia solani AG-8 WAC10335]